MGMEEEAGDSHEIQGFVELRFSGLFHSLKDKIQR